MRLEEGRKLFFFEKKNQETLAVSSAYQRRSLGETRVARATVLKLIV
jgi:hypothetical protein